MLEHLDFAFEVKEVSTDTRTFSGYAAVFGNVDDGRDLIQRGAFTESLAKWATKGKLPKLLWQHDARRVIGKWTELKEDDYGLFGRGSLTAGVRDADEAYALLKDGAIDGLSIGYRTLDDEYDQDTNIRKLVKLDLMEASIVTFAMNDAAGVTGVKNSASFNPRLIERDLKEAIPTLSGRDAVTVVSVLKKHLQRDAEDHPSAAARDETGAMTDLLTAIRSANAGFSS